jgi:hypothetical protein
MATPQEKLAESLRALRELQARGKTAIRSRDLSRTHRERLQAGGFLKEVIKGWYIPSRPDEAPGDSTAWYASFWNFCANYLSLRFGDEWCLSPEQSLALLGGNRTVPAQLVVRTPRGGNKPTALPHGTSLFDVRYPMPPKREIVVRDGLRLFSVPAALAAVSERHFRRAATDVRAAMAMVKDASDVLAVLLGGGHSTIAGRLAGAFRNAGSARIADEILRTMETAGYDVRESDPFEHHPGVFPAVREASPYVNRLRLMWDAMRAPILEVFPAAPGPADRKAYLRAVGDVYVDDAYHSLSIEGYRVSPELVERIRSGAWNPDGNPQDRENRNALAARGYYDAFNAVKVSLDRVLRGENPGSVARDDHAGWYRQLLGPSVTAGIIRAVDLAGYRNGQVSIRRSMHVPPPHEAVRDCMPALFELLQAEAEASVRVVLGHFVFVYIHPYMDGNGRVGRFLMNVMLASGGYPWTIIPVERRDDYVGALESASVGQDIRPFAEFIGALVASRLRGAPAAPVPRGSGGRSLRLSGTKPARRGLRSSSDSSREALARRRRLSRRSFSGWRIGWGASSRERSPTSFYSMRIRSRISGAPRKISAVVANGRFFSRGQPDELLRGVEVEARRGTSGAFWPDAASGIGEPRGRARERRRSRTDGGRRPALPSSTERAAGRLRERGFGVAASEAP